MDFWQERFHNTLAFFGICRRQVPSQAFMKGDPSRQVVPRNGSQISWEHSGFIALLWNSLHKKQNNNTLLIDMRRKHCAMRHRVSSSGFAVAIETTSWLNHAVTKRALMHALSRLDRKTNCNESTMNSEHIEPNLGITSRQPSYIPSLRLQLRVRV